MSTLKNGVKIDESSWNSPNYWPGRPNGIIGVTIHWWGKPEWNQQFNTVAKYLCEKRYDSLGNEVSTSAHYVVSDDRVACLVSPTNRAWHALAGNEQTIGLELDPNGSEKTLENAAQVIAWLEDYFDISLNVYPHHYWTSTTCPGKYSNRLQWLINRANEIKGRTPVTTLPDTVHLEPVTGYPVTQNFGDGARLTVNGVRTNVGGGHTGIDYATPVGVDAVALESGTVLWADKGENLPWTTWADRYYLGGGGFGGLQIDPGLVVVIQHPGYISTYSHLSATKLKAGDRVAQGQVVGQTGGTGFVSGPHLHFEIIPTPTTYKTREDGSMIYGRVDPRPYFTQTVETSKFSTKTASVAVEQDEFDMANIEEVFSTKRKAWGGRSLDELFAEVDRNTWNTKKMVRYLFNQFRIGTPGVMRDGMMGSIMRKLLGYNEAENGMNRKAEWVEDGKRNYDF